MSRDTTRMFERLSKEAHRQLVEERDYLKRKLEEVSRSRLGSDEHLRGRMEPDHLGPLNVADPVQFAAEESLCAHLFLDTKGIPRQREGQTLSLVGRIKELHRSTM